MLKSFAEFILDLAKKDPEQKEIIFAGNYTDFKEKVIYNEKNSSYQQQKAPALCRQIGNIESFIEIVKEEAKRLNNATGNLMTVCFSQKGGYFSVNDNKNDRTHKFERCLSQQWKIFEDSINEEFDHIGILNVLNSLSPSIQDFNGIIAAYSKLRIIGNSEFVSAPQFVDDEAGEGYVINYKLQGNNQNGTGDAKFPTKLKFKMPYSKGSDKLYKIEAEVIITPGRNNSFSARINCPTFENTEEQAILDEVIKFRDEVKELSELLILEDY